MTGGGGRDDRGVKIVQGDRGGKACNLRLCTTPGLGLFLQHRIRKKVIFVLK